MPSHHVPKGVTPGAGLVTPCERVEWSLFTAASATMVLIQAGQQGLSHPDSSGPALLIIVTGTSKDGAAWRSPGLGADHVIDVEKEDPLARIMNHRPASTSLTARQAPHGSGCSASRRSRKAGTIVVQGEMTDFPNFPIGRVTVSSLSRARPQLGVRTRPAQLASKRFPLELITHKFGLMYLSRPPGWQREGGCASARCEGRRYGASTTARHRGGRSASVSGGRGFDGVGDGLG
jgi:hypothetical protein